MRKLSRQRAYEKVREHFLQPGVKYGKERLENGGEQCVYRAGGDPKATQRCSIGVLVSDNLYAQLGDRAEILGPNEILSMIGYDTEFDGLGSFAEDMQKVHDDCAMPGDYGTYGPTQTRRALPLKSFIKALDVFAKDNGLKVPSV